MPISVSGDKNWQSIVRRVLEKAIFGRTIDAAVVPLALNNEFITALNAAGSGTVNLIKSNASNVAQVADSAIIDSAANGTKAIVTCDATQTLSNKTLAAGTSVNANVISLATVKSTAQFDAVTGTTGATLTNVAGLVVTVVPGSYAFRINLPMVTTANAGIKAGFKLTTTVLTSTEYVARLYTASGVAVQHGTTTTDQATMAALTAAATLNTVIEGTMVVGTGGTIQLQAAQNAAHTDTLSIYAGASMTFTRIA